MTNMMDVTRRTMLWSGAALGLTGCGWFAGKIPPLPPTTARAAIDIHCHVFNARDLPVEGFLDSIYISAGPGVRRYAEEALVALLSLIMKGQGIGACTEANQVNGTQSAGCPGEGLESATVSTSRETDAELLREHVRRAAAVLSGEVSSLRQTPHIPGAESASTAQIRAAARVDLLNGIAQRPGFESTEPPSPDAVADGAVKSFLTGSGERELAGLLWLATLTTRPRMELVRRLFALPSSSAGDVRILAPAIVDYGYWLKDQNTTPLAEQIAVMSAIAAHPPQGRAVHGWVSFCPWRQIVEPGQFALVQDAIRNRGFLGVKLYPVMGFYPIGNEQAQLRGERYPADLSNIANFGKKLDDGLRAVYEFCDKEGVPILAHCSHSEYPHLFRADGTVDSAVDVGLRGAPDGWAVVLKEFPELRLNIGHAGGPWDLSLHPDNPSPCPTWTAKVIALTAQYENVYTDIADYSTIYDKDPADNDHILGVLKSYLDQHPGAREKLMYGTDWEMLSLTLGAESYYPKMRELISAHLGLDSRQTEGFFGANAARMAGISTSKGGTPPQTRVRLERFYDTAGLDKAILGLFDA